MCDFFPFWDVPKWLTKFYFCTTFKNLNSSNYSNFNFDVMFAHFSTTTLMSSYLFINMLYKSNWHLKLHGQLILSHKRNSGGVLVNSSMTQLQTIVCNSMQLKLHMVEKVICLDLAFHFKKSKISISKVTNHAEAFYQRLPCTSHQITH